MSSRGLIRRVRSTFLGLLIPLLTHTVGRLPYPLAHRFGHGLARLLLWTNRKHRRLAEQHLRLAFPEADEDEIARLVRDCFRNAALNMVETLIVLARGHEAFDQRLTIEGAEHLAHEPGERVLLLSCHAGFWELLGIASARLGSPVFGFGRRPDDPVFAAVLTKLRRAILARNIERGTAEGRSLLRQVLKGEGAIVMLIDQDTKVDGTWVPFFGRPAYTPTGAAEMALKHHMRVVPAFLERRGRGQHVARYLPPLDLPDDVTQATALMTATIEAHIRRNPAQWVWWHRRWRRQKNR